VPPDNHQLQQLYFFECASSVISLMGKIAPVTFDKCVTEIIFVLGVIFFSISSKVFSPNSLISAKFILIFFDFLKKCHGT
jgi:hypothetical protein